MATVTIDLPDELYERAKQRELSLAAIVREALERELRPGPNDAWIRAVSSRPRRTDLEIDTAELLDDVRDSFGR